MSEKYKNKYRIETTRLHGWDYSSEGGYYITINTKNRLQWFGICTNKKMVLSETGQIANDLWYKIPERHSMVILDEFVVMPNHIIRNDNELNRIRKYIIENPEKWETDENFTV